MPSLPQRRLLASQAALYLAREIQRGRWREWLPAERDLAKDLKVCRNTLRVALSELRRKAVVKAMHGRGNRIVGNPAAVVAPAAVRAVTFLCPRALEQLRPMIALWLDQLRTLLNDQGCQVQVVHGGRYYQTDCEGALAELTRQPSRVCWVLIESNATMQRWFSRQQVPCIVAGTCSAGVKLPGVDLDHRATCRHAAGILLGLGHRRIGFVQVKQRRAADAEGLEAFASSLAASRHREARVTVIDCQPEARNLSQVLRKVMNARKRPTALVISDPYCYLAVTTTLSQQGWKIPQQVSVISRDEDVFLPFVVPTPARYAVSAQVYAKQMLRLILGTFQASQRPEESVRIIPEFIRGGSIGLWAG